MIQGLSVFASAPQNVADNTGILRSCKIVKVVCCALGPKGNNIEQASTQWLKRMGVSDKSEVILCDTPEQCLELARSIKGNGVVAVFWTCAVYSRENQFFFGNPDVFPFFFQEEMPLDEMQLAVRPANEPQILACGGIPAGWRTASHPSPAPLVKGFSEVVLQNSNAAAARACANSDAELCITTESARKIYELVKVHSFGSPMMVFFGGITQHGYEQIEKAREDWKSMCW